MNVFLYFWSYLKWKKFVLYEERATKLRQNWGAQVWYQTGTIRTDMHWVGKRNSGPSCGWCCCFCIKYSQTCDTLSSKASRKAPEETTVSGFFGFAFCTVKVLWEVWGLWSWYQLWKTTEEGKQCVLWDQANNGTRNAKATGKNSEKSLKKAWRMFRSSFKI